MLQLQCLGKRFITVSLIEIINIPYRLLIGVSYTLIYPGVTLTLSRLFHLKALVQDEPLNQRYLN